MILYTIYSRFHYMIRFKFHSMIPDYLLLIHFTFTHSLPLYFLQKPLIDSSSKEGKILDKFDCTIEFKNVHFFYPSRPDVQVCVS